MMEYLAVVRLPALSLITQEAEVEQAKAQELALRKAIDEPVVGANETDSQSENAHRALIKAGEIPAPPRAPVPDALQLQSLSKTKAIIPSSPLTTTISWCWSS
jgi:hypothetical protein